MPVSASLPIANSGPIHISRMPVYAEKVYLNSGSGVKWADTCVQVFGIALPKCPYPCQDLTRRD